jgi:hypothetical protein
MKMKLLALTFICLISLALIGTLAFGPESKMIWDNSARAASMLAPQAPADFGPREDNTYFDGTRIAYYQRPSVDQCQSDCASNGNCQGFTWIQAGTYNPRDAAMCYLFSAVTGKGTARGHISAVKAGGCGELRVIRAAYGEQGKFFDVTQRLQFQVRGGKLNVQVTNDSMGGDPIYNVVKKLYVKYECRGTVFDKTINENGTLTVAMSSS